MTIIAAAMVATNWNARITVCGLFIAASIAWIADGIIEPKNSLIIQNAVLLVINVLGVWRWLPRAGKEAAAPWPRTRDAVGSPQACFLSEIARRASAASPASVKAPSVVCPFLAHVTMLSAIKDLNSWSAPSGLPLQIRSSAASMFARVRRSKLSRIMGSSPFPAKRSPEPGVPNSEPAFHYEEPSCILEYWT
jgi:hypothetical protein